MSSSTKADWLIPAGLIALSFIPIAAGIWRMLVPCGLVVALSGLWMTQFYPTGIDPPARFDGPFLYVIRLLAGSAMALFLVSALLLSDGATSRVIEPG